VKNPWVAWYPGEYIGKTRRLSMAQHGAYMLLLWEYYINGPLLANATDLLNVCCAKTEADQVDMAYVLERFFVLRDGFYYNERADEEIARRESIREKRKLVGQKGGLAKATVLLEQKARQSQSQSQEKILKAYVHPTLSEVSQYCAERNNNVDSAKWFDYYSSNGWRVGRNPMRDWKAAVRTWEKNSYGGAFDDGHTKTDGHGASRRDVAPTRVSTQAQRAFNNIAAVATVLGTSNRLAPEERGAGVADRSLADGSGQAPRPSTARTALLGR